MPAVNAKVVSKGETRESYGWIATIALPSVHHKARVPDADGRWLDIRLYRAALTFAYRLLRSCMRIHAASAYCERGREAEAESIVLRGLSLRSSRRVVRYYTCREMLSPTARS